jgi:hypothetical protein
VGEWVNEQVGVEVDIHMRSLGTQISFILMCREYLYVCTGSTALSFTATGVLLATEAQENFADEPVCLMVDNVWNEGRWIA